jgi:multicomponent Na+:H+ antiporter subunit G
MRGVLADVFIVLGLVIVTIGVYGVVRLPDVYTQLHASGKAAFLGVVFLLLAAGLEGDGPILTRVVLITVLLAVTTPVAAHVVGQAAHIRGEEMRTPGAVDETARSPVTRDAVR